MANFCINCGKKLPLLYKRTHNKVCRECLSALEAKHRQARLEAVESIKQTRICTADQLAFLATYPETERCGAYYNLYKHFTATKFFDNDAVTLQRVQQALSLSEEEARRERKRAIEKQRDERLENIERCVKESRTCTPDQIDFLRTCEANIFASFYSRVCNSFVDSGVIDEKTLQLLQVMRQARPDGARVAANYEYVVEARRAAQRESVGQNIIATGRCTSKQLQLLKTHNQADIRTLYFSIYSGFVQSRDMDEQDLYALSQIQKVGLLTSEDVKYDEYILPYCYVNSIRCGQLPSYSLKSSRSHPPILRLGEKVHYAHSALVNEINSPKVNTVGSGGVQWHVSDKARYRAGAHLKHYIASRSLLRQTSSGLLIITNKRLFLHSLYGGAPTNITFGKILNYSCYANDIQLWIEGRKKPYIFTTTKTAPIEIFGLCLGFLLDLGIRKGAKQEQSPFRHIPPEVKERVLARDDYRCVICGRSDGGIHFDHIIPVSKGGDNTEQNIQLLCPECNLRKSDKII